MADSKKYDGSQWEHSLRKLTTATETVENPLYSDGTAITAYTIKGNTVQNGAPTPSNPVPVVGVGEIETSEEHTGEYKIPISSGGVTTNNYLGSTQTVRQIKKIVFDGTEHSWTKSVRDDPTSYLYHINITTINYGVGEIEEIMCTHEPYSTDYPVGNTQGCTFKAYQNEYKIFYINLGSDIMNAQTSGNTVEGLKEYLAQQYATGTPVTVWYVLATPETAAVNEPLMKIGNYADTLSNAASIPTTEGANSITVDTTVQPSEFTATWTGWHNAEVREWDGSEWQ